MELDGKDNPASLQWWWLSEPVIHHGSCLTEIPPAPCPGIWCWLVYIFLDGVSHILLWESSRNSQCWKSLGKWERWQKQDPTSVLLWSWVPFQRGPEGQRASDQVRSPILCTYLLVIVIACVGLQLFKSLIMFRDYSNLYLPVGLMRILLWEEEKCWDRQVIWLWIIIHSRNTLLEDTSGTHNSHLSRAGKPQLFRWL